MKRSMPDIFDLDSRHPKYAPPERPQVYHYKSLRIDLDDYNYGSGQVVDVNYTVMDDGYQLYMIDLDYNKPTGIDHCILEKLVKVDIVEHEGRISFDV